MQKEKNQEKQKEEEKPEENFRRQMEKEFEMEKKKLEIQKKNFEIRGEILREERYKNVKLLKLIISKFVGPHIDWFRFWNQYETEIDMSRLYPVSKFSYLKELLAPKVRLLIDTLHFTSEGYFRAIAILKAKLCRSYPMHNISACYYEF